jgi:hypothetical protein
MFKDLEVPINKIISSSELTRNYKEMSKKIDQDGIDFVFKNNTPDKVIMTYSKYQEFLDMLEHIEIYLTVKKFDENDNGKRYTLDEVLKEAENV